MGRRPLHDDVHSALRRHSDGGTAANPSTADTAQLCQEEPGGPNKEANKGQDIQRNEESEAAKAED